MGLELPDREIVTWLKSAAQPTAPPRRPQTFIFLLQICAMPTLCAVPLMEEAAKSGWRAPGWWESVGLGALVVSA